MNLLEATGGIAGCSPAFDWGMAHATSITPSRGRSARRCQRIENQHPPVASGKLPDATGG
jgi:hypothetical protein